MFNSRNPLGKGFKTPLKLQTKDTWEKILLSIAQYLTSLETNTTPPQPLSILVNAKPLSLDLWHALNQQSQWLPVQQLARLFSRVSNLGLLYLWGDC
jgi:hypothetical protein